MRSISFKILMATLSSVSFAPAQAQPSPLSDLSQALSKPNTALVRGTLKEDVSRIDVITFDPASKTIKSRIPTALHCSRVHTGTNAVFCFGVPKPLIKAVASPVYANNTVLSLDYSLKTQMVAGFNNGNIVSRARVSANGQYAATTAFTLGSSGYAPSPTGQLSTQALIYVLPEKRVLLDLERWPVYQDGKTLSTLGLNVWGVTFHPTDNLVFYATVMAQNKIYLVKGNLKTFSMQVIDSDIECPSISPDGKHLAFKQRRAIGGWNAAVFNIETAKKTTLTDAHSIDDQIEWLDNQTLVYEKITSKPAGVKIDLFVRAAFKPNQAAKLWLEHAGSPSFIRS